MKERPILFSTPMVRAILDGRKTQTRRVMKKQPNIDPQTGDWLIKNSDGSEEVEPIEQWIKIQKMLHCPYGQPGDRLWVRETFAEVGCIGKPIDWFEYHYKADYTGGIYTGYSDMCFDRWKPSIFMPREASRITLEITDVRVERLNEISELDAISEGIDPLFSHNEIYKPNYRAELDLKPMPYINYMWKKYPFGGHYSSCNTAKDSFFSLWKSINGKDSLIYNPWVWVITFKRL